MRRLWMSLLLAPVLGLAVLGLTVLRLSVLGLGAFRLAAIEIRLRTRVVVGDSSFGVATVALGEGGTCETQ